MRGEIERRRVRGADDSGELIERRVAELVPPDEGIEAALRADVRIVDIRDVVGGGAMGRGEGAHFGTRHVEELRRRIDEAPDEPRAGNPVDLRPLACDPAGRCRERLRGVALGAPLLETAGDIARVKATRAQSGACALAYLVTAHAIDDDRAPRLDRGGPSFDRLGQASQGAGDDLSILFECRLPAHVDERGRRKCREPLLQFNGSDSRIHGFQLPPAAWAATKQNLDGAGPAMRRDRVCASPARILCQINPSSN